MKTYASCIPCLVKQTVRLSRMLKLPPGKKEQILREVLSYLSRISYYHPPPYLSRSVYRTIKEVSGIEDPYQEIKRRVNEKMAEIFPKLEARIAGKTDIFDRALRLVIAGNTIDFGTEREFDFEKELAEAGSKPLVLDETKELKKAIVAGKTILYIGDNAGETFLDKLFISCFPNDKKVWYGVRGAPIINDATRDDAEAAGLEEVAEIVENGSDAPGTIIDDCSAEFKRLFATADLVIAKGQGNYETLSEESRDNIFFLLMVKCPVIADDIGCPLNGMVVAKKR
jgi:uncharacterized protein with ATP-grasp and redox domains